MDRSERFYKICKRLAKGRPVPAHVFLEDLEISRPTFYRDIEYLRDRFNAPIQYQRGARGYCFDPGADNFELPGLWFSASEAHALLTFQQLLNEVQPEFLQSVMQPLHARLEKLLEKNDASLHELRKRIRILSLGRRDVEANYFELISHAVLIRKRLSIDYYNRERDDSDRREISPQRLVHYRDNWYLDAYDHVRSGLRTFSLDAIENLRLVDRRARNIAETRLEKELGTGYGIFAGQKTQTARLKFNAYRARWVSREQWHPKQTGHWSEDGSYVLEIPYADDRELLMDILKYGPDVEVLAPKNLRARARECLKNALTQYKN
ncbi:MAG: WYL domain-containing protein [Gammaproteobacteria bacterium]|nr:MAG: WYL domain-containing protein [Gammaproteobacteria bacterium]